MTLPHEAMTEKAQFEMTITAELVAGFAAFSGDFNPLHMDAAYAAQTKFKERVAHGMIAGAFFSRLIGMHVPGNTSLYLSQSLFFRKPLFIGTTVCVRGEVTHKAEERNIVTVATSVCDAHSGVVLVDGEAVVQLL